MTLILSRHGNIPEDLPIKTVPAMPSLGIERGFVIIGDYQITLEDFCSMAEYVLTNTNLESKDPRLPFQEKMREMVVGDGFPEVRDGKIKRTIRLQIPHEPPTPKRRKAK